MEKPAINPNEKSQQPLQDHGGVGIVNSEKVHVATAEHLEGGPRITALATTFTLAEEKRVICSLDWHIMPLIFLLYSLSVLDHSNLGNARIAGLDKDLHLSSQQYNWLATVFYIAYGYHHSCLNCGLNPDNPP